MKKTRQIALCLVGVTMLVSLAGCESEPQEVKIKIEETILRQEQKAEVKRGDIRVSAFYDAWVGPLVEQLTFEKEGFFGEFTVRLGDTVKKGDILAIPYIEDGEEAVKNQEKELESLRVNYEYQKATLENQKQIAQYELDNAYNELKLLEYPSASYEAMCIQAGNAEQKEKRLELRLKQLTETYELQKAYGEKKLAGLKEKTEGNVIRAPFDGEVVALADALQGDTLNAQWYYVALADNTVRYARCENIATAVLDNADQIVFWKDGAEYDTTFVPQTEEYYKEKKNSGEQAYAQFLIDAPEDVAAIGDYGKIRLISRQKKDVVLAPELALQFASGINYVYVDVDGKKQRVDVEVGLKDGVNAEIVSGLKEGDIVYVQ